MAASPDSEGADVRHDVVARGRARVADGDWPDADAVALAILTWTCRRVLPTT